MPRLPLLALITSALFATPALAQDESEAAWGLSSSASVLSDYVWRGVSQTGGDPALQGELYLEHASGFYVGGWASTVDFTGPGEDDDGIDWELDAIVGWSGALGENAEIDVFLSRVVFPGSKDGFDYDYTELEVDVSFAEYFTVGVAYSNDIFNLGGKGIYYFGGAELPLGDSGIGLLLNAGHYDLEDAAGDSYNDYLVGLARDFGPIRAELHYTDTSGYGEELSENLDDASQADGRVALALRWAF
jgi:uncharacterized protein (TIGR02001 family)